MGTPVLGPYSPQGLGLVSSGGEGQGPGGEGETGGSGDSRWRSRGAQREGRKGDERRKLSQGSEEDGRRPTVPSLIQGSQPHPRLVSTGALLGPGRRQATPSLRLSFLSWERAIVALSNGSCSFIFLPRGPPFAAVTSQVAKPLSVALSCPGDW